MQNLKTGIDSFDELHAYAQENLAKGCWIIRLNLRTKLLDVTGISFDIEENKQAKQALRELNRESDKNEKFGMKIVY